MALLAMANKRELGQLRFIASASRPLVREKSATALLALDALQGIAKRWDWLWLALVCTDGTEITAQMEISDAIATINSHGGVAGIIGAALIDRQFRFLRKPLVRGPRVKSLLEASAKAEEKRLWDDVRESIRRVFREGGTEVRSAAQVSKHGEQK